MDNNRTHQVEAIAAIAAVVEKQGSTLEMLTRELARLSAMVGSPQPVSPQQAVQQIPLAISASGQLVERLLEKPMTPEHFAQVTAVLAGPDKANELAASMLVLHKMEEWAPRFLAVMEAQRLRAQGSPEIQRLREEVEVRELKHRLRQMDEVSNLGRRS